MTDAVTRIPDIDDFFECSVWLVLTAPEIDDSGFDSHAWVVAAWEKLVEAVPRLTFYGEPVWNNAHCHLSFYRFANHGASGVEMLRQLVKAFPEVFPDGYGAIHFRAADEDGTPFSRITIGAAVRDV